MPFRFYFFFIFITLITLSYPGYDIFYNIISFDRKSFVAEASRAPIKIHPIPVVNSNSEIDISAQGIYIVELDSFTPIFERNSHKKFFPASTTKIITALVAADLYGPDEIITIKNVMQEGQVMGLIPSEKITAENLMYGILVHSGNDAAYALAENYGYDAFIKRMNEKAKELGMIDSHFTNPAGLDNSKQFSSPFDLAIAGRKLLKNSYLRKMVGTKEIIISDVDYKVFHTLTNVNRLLGEIQGLGGLKTGYTENAGENLVSFYRHQEHDYVIVVMNSEDRFADTSSIVQWIQSNVRYINPEI